MGHPLAHLHVPVEARVWPTAWPGCSRRGPLPTWALGGVDVGNAAECLESGAAGVAVMGAVLGSPDPATAFAQIQDRLDEVQL